MAGWLLFGLRRSWSRLGGRLRGRIGTSLQLGLDPQAAPQRGNLKGS